LERGRALAMLLGGGKEGNFVGKKLHKGVRGSSLILTGIRVTKSSGKPTRRRTMRRVMTVIMVVACWR